MQLHQQLHEPEVTLTKPSRKICFPIRDERSAWELQQRLLAEPGTAGGNSGSPRLFVLRDLIFFNSIIISTSNNQSLTCADEHESDECHTSATVLTLLQIYKQLIGSSLHRDSTGTFDQQSLIKKPA